jgi:two-component system sensor kinase FixL
VLQVKFDSATASGRYGCCNLALALLSVLLGQFDPDSLNSPVWPKGFGHKVSNSWLKLFNKPITVMTIQSLLHSKYLGAMCFSVAYIATDALSFIHPIGQFNITPWNPPAALQVLCLMLMGWPWMAWTYLTLFVSDGIVRGTVGLLTPEVYLGNALLVICYASIAIALRKFILNKSHLTAREETVTLSLIVFAGTFITAASYIGLLSLIGGLGTTHFESAFFRFFVGDLLGMMVLLPLAFVFLDQRRIDQFADMLKSKSYWVLVLILVFCLWGILSLSIELRMKYFFPIFFAVGLMAAAHSLPGATVSLLLVQLPLVLSASHPSVNPESLLELQIVMLTLTLTGLVIGTVVDERMRAQEHLRDSLQLIAAGELAGSLAHELHQPMSALNAYAESALILANGGAGQGATSSSNLLQSTLRKIADETIRASEIVRGLRSFFISGSSKLQNSDAVELVNACIAHSSYLAKKQGVELQANLTGNAPVYIDPIQIQTAVTNLIKNAIETSLPGQLVRVTNSTEGGYFVIRILDEGEALSRKTQAAIFRPLYTQKRHGLGLGLSVSKSLVEHNGGKLVYESDPSKCFAMYLPIAE